MSRVKHNAMHQYTGGLNNAPTGGPNLLPFPTPGLQGWKWLYQDYAHGVLYTADTVEYELEIVGTTPAPIPAANGVSLPTTTADNSMCQIRDTTAQVILGASTKKFYLETSFMLTAADVDQNEIFVGYSTDATSTAMIDAGGTVWALDAAIGFGKGDAATELDLIIRAADVEQTIGMGAMVTATRYKFGVYYDGTKYYAYKNDVLVGEGTAQVYPATVMGTNAYIRTGEGALQSLLVNYIALGTEL